MGVVIVEEKGVVWRVNLGRPIVTNGGFATRLFPNYFGQDLFNYNRVFHVLVRTTTQQSQADGDGQV